MTTYATGNPIGSTDPKDLFDNAENLDLAVNSADDEWVDRLGGARKTMRALENALPELLAARDDVVAMSAQSAGLNRRYTSTTAAQADATLLPGMMYSVPDATYRAVLKIYERDAGGSALRNIDAVSLNYVFADESTGRAAVLGAGGGLGTRFLYLGSTGNEITAQISSTTSGGASIVISTRATSGTLLNATTGRKTLDATGVASPYSLTSDDKQYSALTIIGTPVDDPMRIVIGAWAGVIENMRADGKPLLIRYDGSDAGIAIPYSYRALCRAGGDNKVHVYWDGQPLIDETVTRAAADATEIVERKKSIASAKDLLLMGYSGVANRTGAYAHVGYYANAVGIDCATSGGDVMPGAAIKRIPIRCKPGTGATKAVIKISSRLTSGGTVDSAPGAVGDAEVISLTLTLAELGLTPNVQSTCYVVLPYPFTAVDGLTYIREMTFVDDSGTRIASDWGAALQSGLPARKRGYYRLTAGAGWSAFDAGSNATEWQLEVATYALGKDMVASVAAVNATIAPINSTLLAEARAGATRRRYRGPKPSYIEAATNLIWDLPLTSSLFANVGLDLTFARAASAAIVDCYGAWQPTRSQEARFWGARRVENLVLDDTFTSGWTLGANVTKTLIDTRLGPYRQRQNVHRFARSSGSGPFLTLNSASYRPGQYAVSVYAASTDGSSAYTIQVQRSADSAVIAQLSITPSVMGFTRYGLPFDLPDTQNYRVVITAAAGAGSLDLACAQLERLFNQPAVPSEYVPRGSAWDAAPWQGANVDGVRYYDYYNPCNLSAAGVVTESRNWVEIPADVRKGLMIGPTRVNKFYESRDIGAASWALTNSTAAGAMIASGLLGPSSLRKLEETAAAGTHRVTQSWHGTLPSDNVMITIAVFVPLSAAERNLLVIGFFDKAGAEKKSIVNIATRTVISQSGDVYKTHITKIGDLLRIGFTDKSGSGGTTPIGFFGLANLVSGSVLESYAGTAGAGMYMGALQFERTDHPCIYLGDTGTTTPGGTADDTNTPIFPAAMGQNDWTVSCECTPMYDSDSQTKSSWSYVWYATVASNIRWGCGIRPGAFGGAVVEDYVKNPVFDCYAGTDGLGVPQTPHEVFDVANCLHITPALQTVLWQISLHPAAYDGSSNIAMYVGGKQGVLDSNGTHIVSKVPLSANFKIGYKNVPIDEKCIKNFKVFAKAVPWSEMARGVD